jgi:hypothetical protein
MEKKSISHHDRTKLNLHPILMTTLADVPPVRVKIGCAQSLDREEPMRMRLLITMAVNPGIDSLTSTIHIPGILIICDRQKRNVDEATAAMTVAAAAEVTEIDICPGMKNRHMKSIDPGTQSVTVVLKNGGRSSLNHQAVGLVPQQVGRRVQGPNRITTGTIERRSGTMINQRKNDECCGVYETKRSAVNGTGYGRSWNVLGQLSALLVPPQAMQLVAVVLAEGLNRTAVGLWAMSVLISAHLGKGVPIPHNIAKIVTDRVLVNLPVAGQDIGDNGKKDRRPYVCVYAVDFYFHFDFDIAEGGCKLTVQPCRLNKQI